MQQQQCGHIAPCTRTIVLQNMNIACCTKAPGSVLWWSLMQSCHAYAPRAQSYLEKCLMKRPNRRCDDLAVPGLLCPSRTSPKLATRAAREARPARPHGQSLLPLLPRPRPSHSANPSPTKARGRHERSITKETHLRPLRYQRAAFCPQAGSNALALLRCIEVRTRKLGIGKHGIIQEAQ